MAIGTSLDPKRVKEALEDWLRGPLDSERVEVQNLAIPEAGFSADTLLFDAGGESFVARIAPRGPGLFPTYDVIGEARVIQALAAHTDVRVADVLAAEPDPDVLGAPFFVMRRTPGRIPLDDPPYTLSGWVVDLPVEGRAKIYEEFIDQLAAIHGVDWRALGLDFIAHPEDGSTALDQHLTVLDRYYEFASEGRRDSPLLDVGLAWLQEHRPADDDRVVLSWGDCHPHNMIYADDLSAAACLDWEMMSLASPELDVALLTFSVRLYTEGMDIPRLEGFPDSATIVARYEAASGITISDLDYWEVFNAVRVALVLLRMGRLMIAAEILPPDATMPVSNPGTKLLARMLDLPESGVAVQDWSGLRS